MGTVGQRSGSASVAVKAILTSNQTRLTNHTNQMP